MLHYKHQYTAVKNNSEDIFTMSITVIQEQVWEADVGILLTRVDYLVWNVTERCCWDTKAFIGQCRWMREVGGVTGKRDVGYKAANCKEGHGYIFVYFDKWSNFRWSPVRLDHSAYDIYIMINKIQVYLSSK